MQLYFVRHAQSENNHLWDRTGSDKGRSDDPLLTEVGRKQAVVAARFLSTPRTGEHIGLDLHNLHGFGITHVYASLMVRAVETGSAIARACGVPLVALEDLHETGGIYLQDEASGDYIQRPGKNRAFFAAHYPDCALPDCVTDEGWWNRPFEPHEQRPLRARRVVEYLLAQHGQSDDRVVAVTHGAFYNYVLAVILNLDEAQLERYWFVMNNVAITRMDFRDNHFVMAYLNRVDFLPRELIT